jgi:tetratricopeptide (TPR) repeat protein
MKDHWLILFLSSLFLFASGCMSSALSQNCNDKKFQDSLIHRYVENGAEKLPYHYNNPLWASYFDSLLAICPQIASAYQLKAVPAIKNGEYTKAFALNDVAVNLDPQQFLSYRGFLKCIFTKDYTGAIIDFKKAIQIIPGGGEMDHSFYFYLGLCYLELGEYQNSSANFAEDIFSQDGGDSSKEVHYNSLLYMGIVNFENKEPDSAKIYLMKCLNIYKELPEANYYLALIYKSERNTALEIKYLELARNAMLEGYSMNEDNLFYANYPHQITLFEINKAISEMQ